MKLPRSSFLSKTQTKKVEAPPHWIKAREEHETVFQWYHLAYAQLVATPEKTIAQQDMELRLEAWRRIDAITAIYLGHVAGTYQ